MMCPRLPLVLQEKILALAIPDDHRRPRQQIRRQLSLVCRAWRSAIRFGTDLDILSMAQAVRLRDQLRTKHLEFALDSPNEPRREQARAAYFKLRKVPEEDEAALGELLEMLVNLEQLTIELNGGDRSLLRVDSVRNGLSGLRRMKRFAFLGLDPVDPSSPAAPLSKHAMQRILPNWVDLESLALEHCFVAADKDKPFALDFYIQPSKGKGRMKPRGLLSLHPKLHTLRLHPLGFTGDCEEFLVDLPLSLRHFSHKGFGLYNSEKPTPEKPVSAAVIKHLSLGARQLEVLTLTDVRSLLTRCVAARGVYDRLVRKLVAVRKLSLSPTAVSHLSELLAPLEFLTELELVQGEAISLEPLNYHETVLFVTRAKALRTISISQEIRANWSQQQAAHIEHEAARKGITVLWPVRIR